ncbi:addiction module toxin RelE [Deinococcus radiomollis]|uniref:addiction module toxin RelE n=1 Tax=Deinococcus radiomollis TaxID=468916 RepID=UPI0038912C4E
MPDAWNDKDERQYQHVKDSERERGAGEEQAEEIAARTVNKQRREEGRTPNKRTQGTGNPNRALADLSRDELYNRARAAGLPGRSRMSKTELIAALGK